jgi:MFS family permease
MTASQEPPAETRPTWQRMSAAWRSGPLAVRNFRLLTAGQLASTLGDFCYAVALPWLVLSTHGGPVLLGTVLACYGVPRVALIPVGGALTDKIGARTLMLAADVVRCAAVAVLALLATRHIASLAALGPLAAVIGGGEGLFLPASYSIMPSLLEPDQLAASNSVYYAAVQAGALLGPAIGGALVATVGSGPAFAVDAGSFAVSALTLALIPRRRAAAKSAGPVKVTESATATDPGANGGVGKLGVLGLLRRARAMQVVVMMIIVANLTSGGLRQVALPALAHAKYGAAGYGALLACLAAGGVVGTLLAARTKRLRRPANAAALAFVVQAAAMCLVPYLGGEAGAAAAMFVFGGGNGLGNVIWVTAGQKWTPPHLLGRISALMMMCALGTFPASVALTGLLVHHLGPTLFFPVAGAVVGVAMLAGLSQREYRDFGTAQADGTYLLAGLKGLNRTVKESAAQTTAMSVTEVGTER